MYPHHPKVVALLEQKRELDKQADAIEGILQNVALESDYYSDKNKPTDQRYSEVRVVGDPINRDGLWVRV